MITTDWFLNKCKSLNIHNRVYIAYSGGMDSSILLYLFSITCKKLNIKLKALHVNHSYSNKAMNWLYFCKKQCDKLNIPLNTYTIKSAIQHTEEQFRINRFAYFSNIVLKNSTLAMAHHKDDFIETFFLNLFRGTGFTGLNSIKKNSKIKNLNIIRPFIEIEKTHIRNYAKYKKISYITDFSNFSFISNRNVLRYNIFPLIIKVYPAFENKIQHYMVISTKMYNIIHNKYVFFLHSKGYSKNILLIKYLWFLPLVLRYEIFLLWIRLNNYKTPHYSHLYEINKLMYSEKNIKSCINLNKYIIKKYKNYLYIEKNKLSNDDNTFLYIKSKNQIYYKKTMQYKNYIRNYKSKSHKEKERLIFYKKRRIVMPGLWSTSYLYILHKNIIILLSFY